jgi:hypothetical protein
VVGPQDLYLVSEQFLGQAQGLRAVTGTAGPECDVVSVAKGVGVIGA